MHDLDRTRAEYEAGLETGLELEGEGEGEGEAFEFGETAQEGEAPLNEMQEMELAAELLEISNEGELNQFLGKLIRSAGRAVGSFVKSPVGQALGGILKQAARKALPIAGAALGNLVAPGIGGAIGGQLASKAGSLFGLELEGLSGEDREFEVARRFVRLGATATRNAIRYQNRLAAARAARLGFATAARRWAPGLVSPRIASSDVTYAPATDQPVCTCGAADGDGGGDQEFIFGGGYGSANGGGYGSASGGGVARGRAGRWFRRGGRIVLLGI